MQTIFESNAVKKSQITLEELQNETSNILPNREELQVMDYSMLNTPYYAAPTYSSNFNTYGAYATPTAYDPNSFQPVYQPQFQQYAPQQVVPPQYDYTHYQWNSPTMAYHTQTYSYDQNCYQGNHTWNNGNWDTQWNDGNHNWNDNSKVDSKDWNANPTDWNQYSYRAYIYPNPDYNGTHVAV